MTESELKRFEHGSKIKQQLKFIEYNLSLIKGRFDDFKSNKTHNRYILSFKEYPFDNNRHAFSLCDDQLFEDTIGIEYFYELQIKLLEDLIEKLNKDFKNL